MKPFKMGGMKPFVMRPSITINRADLNEVGVLIANQLLFKVPVKVCVKLGSMPTTVRNGGGYVNLILPFSIFN